MKKLPIDLDSLLKTGYSKTGLNAFFKDLGENHKINSNMEDAMAEKNQVKLIIVGQLEDLKEYVDKAETFIGKDLMNALTQKINEIQENVEAL